MAILKIVPEEDYKILMEYLSEPSVVLLPESVLAKFSPDVQRKFRQLEQEGQVDYDFGGDPDTYVDVIRSDWGYAYRMPRADKRLLRRIELLCEMFPGRERMIIVLVEENRRLGAECVIRDSLVRELKELLGEDCVVVK